MLLAELKDILEKDYLIHTYSATELCEDPAMVSQRYLLHAKTHITLGDTRELEERVIRCLLENERALIGAVVGDYGMGKTSLLIRLWHVCEKAGLLAVPPYVWTSFSDNFYVLNRWAEFRLSANEEAVKALANLRQKFERPMTAQFVKEATERGIDYSSIADLVQSWAKEKRLRLDLTEDDYLSYLSALTDLVREAGLFKGVVVFHDELQVTAAELSMATTANHIFQLASKLSERTGPYGLMVGLPRDTQAKITEERRDIPHRLKSRGCLIDLSTVYGRDFPRQLWEAFAQEFGFSSEKFEIVEEEALDALGEIAARPDLGNGPRSVVSAFNVIAQHYQDTKSTYTIEQLVDDFMRGRIILQATRYEKALKDLLAQPFAKQYEAVVRLIGAFPLGCPVEVVKKRGLETELQEFVGKAFGDMVYETPNGYALTSLSPPQVTQTLTAVERKLKSFLWSYAAGEEELRLAVEGFREYVIPYLLPPRAGYQVHGWTPISGRQWTWDRYQQKGFSWTTEIEGTFERTTDYPKRVVRLFVCDETGQARGPTKDEDFVLAFKLDSKASKAIGSIQCEDTAAVFCLPVSARLEGSKIVGIDNRLIPRDRRTPMFLLGLARELAQDQRIPKSEERTVRAIIEDISKTIVSALFDEDLVSSFSACGAHIDNQGRLLVEDLFRYLCQKRFPDYVTLITQPQWERKLEDYAIALERLPLSIARGREPYDPGGNDAEANRRATAKLFNLGVGSFAAWAETLPHLFDLSDWRSKGRIGFKIHPLETVILGIIEECPEHEMIPVGGKRCKSAHLRTVCRQCIALGYTEEEALFMIKRLGVARKFFHFDPERELVYCIPLEPEELKTQLETELENLQAWFMELVEAGIIESQAAPIDFSSTHQSIRALKGEEDFERIRHSVNIANDELTTWIRNAISKRTVDLETLIGKAQAFAGSVENGESFKFLSRRLTGQAAWVATITRIQNSLFAGMKKTLSDLKKKARELKIAADRGEALKERVTREITPLADYFEVSESVAASLQDTLKDLEVQEKHAALLRHWHFLLEVSDQAWQAALECERFGRKEPRLAHQQLSAEVNNHLENLTREGLKDWEVFKHKYGAILEQAESIVSQAKRAFLQERAALLDLLKSVQARASVLRTSFDPVNPEESFSALYDEVQEYLTEVVNELKADLLALRRELDYASHVLGREEAVQKSNLHDVITNLLEIVGAVANEPAKDRGAVAKIASTLSDAWNAYANALRTYRQDLALRREPQGEEQQVLALLDKSEDRDLKEVILAIAEESGEFDLESILERTKELFRKGLVSIKIRRLA